MSDNTNVVWGKFFSERTKTLWERFPGYYRALVVETNDSLNMYRVRFKCPDMHDFSILNTDCPWAVPSFELGGKSAGRWVAPVIGDWVWITFERQHPYGPIWTGFADPTRRRFYSYPQIFQITPLSVNEDGKTNNDPPQDYDEDYLPKDGRPMGHGWQDRYGNLELHSAVGFFPSEHQKKPLAPDHDALAGSRFEQKTKEPEVNNPDKKYMARVTKYGHIFIMGDQGYHWQSPEVGPQTEDELSNADLGEFTGDAVEDEKFEFKRWLYVQRLLNDNIPSSVPSKTKQAVGRLPGDIPTLDDGNNSEKESNKDQRKILMMTRYGSRFEMRDIGWAQKGPIESKSRAGEFGPPRILSQEEKNDHRWIKVRTKGGMLFQMYDKGFDPAEDKFITRHLLEESGVKSEMENKYWGDRDARWIRMVTRYGIKFTLDDRGSDKKNADKKEVPRGVGVLLKGRRTPAAKKREATGNSRGFQFEFNERDDANHSTWCSPLGMAIELNDRYQYMMLTAALGKRWVPKWQGIKNNEYLEKPTMIQDPELRTHHLKLDHDNEYIRLKTKGPRSKGVTAETSVNLSDIKRDEINQGMEARDGKNGDGPWVEMVDCQHRGFWFSRNERLGVWRSSKKKKMYQWMDEKSRKIVIYNDEASGAIEIYGRGDVKVFAGGNLRLQSDKHIFMKANRTIRMQAGGTKFTMVNGRIETNATYFGPKVNAFVCGVMPGPGAGCAQNGKGVIVERFTRPDKPDKIEPTDRGKTYNKPFEKAEKIK